MGSLVEYFISVSISPALQSEYTPSDCCSSIAPAGSAKRPSSRLAAAGGGWRNNIDFVYEALDKGILV